MQGYSFWIWALECVTKACSTCPKPQNLKSQPNDVCGCEAGKLSFLLPLFALLVFLREGKRPSETL